MKNLTFLSSFIFVLGIIPGILHAQTLHTVEVSNFVFTPSNLTITVDDTVRWININGDHNVVADDNSFTSGPPSTSNWVYDHVFTSEGNNPYYCVLHGGPGGSGMSGVVTVMNPVSVSDQNIVINKYELMQNYPNPFNPSTIIKYNLPESGDIKLSVYNLAGEEIAVLKEGFSEEGTYRVEFHGNKLASSIYFYKLQARNFIQIKKMLLIK